TRNKAPRRNIAGMRRFSWQAVPATSLFFTQPETSASRSSAVPRLGLETVLRLHSTDRGEGSPRIAKWLPGSDLLLQGPPRNSSAPAQTAAAAGPLVRT